MQANHASPKLQIIAQLDRLHGQQIGSHHRRKSDEMPRRLGHEGEMPGPVNDNSTVDSAVSFRPGGPICPPEKMFGELFLMIRRLGGDAWGTVLLARGATTTYSAMVFFGFLCSD